MAILANKLSLLLFILLSFSLHAQSRDSKFFTKAIHYITHPTNSLSPTPSPSPAPAPELELAPAPAPAEFGYGLYGRGSGDEYQTPSDTTTLESSNVQENENPKEIFSPESNGKFLPESYTETDGDSFPTGKFTSETPFEKLSGESYSSTSYNYNNNGNGYNNNGVSGYSSSENENNGYNNNGINGFSSSKNEYMSSRKENNGYNNYGVNGYSSSENENNGYNNNVNGYEMGQQGMSDTRFLENGKYSYDGGYNGDSKYEFDSMDEYERQEGYPQTRREYIP